jgi:MFS family permease
MRIYGRGCVVTGMIVSGVSVALFPWCDNLTGWLGLRFVTGIVGAMSLIPTETMVNHNAPPEQRARNFGFYAFAMACGIALGILAGLQLFDAQSVVPFQLAGVVSVLGGVLMWQVSSIPSEDSGQHGAGRLEFGRNWLSFGSAWSQGFLEGGMVAFLTPYLLFLGHTESLAAWLLGGTMIGVILVQVPVAWLADRLGRVAVLFACYGVVAVALMVMPFSFGLVGLGLCLFLLGACSSAFYPLGLALLGERVRAAGLARANAWYLGLNCLGSLTGPLIMGRAMDRFGKPALFAVGEGAVLLVMVSWALLTWHSRRKGSRPKSIPIGSSVDWLHAQEQPLAEQVQQ